MYSFRTLTLIACLCVATSGCSGFRHDKNTKVAGPRQVISLDGTWEIAEGSMHANPSMDGYVDGKKKLRFDHRVKVPGLISMAQPPFTDVAPNVAHRREVPQKDPRRDAFYYKRIFEFDGPVPAVASLKISKAVFGTRVFLNGKLAGDHLPCFTPGFFDVSRLLKTGKNELVIRVGADRDSLGDVVASGFDFEKERYIPGIFDSVCLVLSGTPHIVEVQAAPDITNNLVAVQSVIHNTGIAKTVSLSYTVRETKSHKIVGHVTNFLSLLPAGQRQSLRVNIPITNCRLWSPEDPFLYSLEVDCGSDSWTTRFGMRDFKLDPATGRPMLNGKPYFLRGSNITLYRFFEDPECGSLPWDTKWVRDLHRRVKDMNWNSLRYCIGFPPELWYEIADEEGILLQDEFPIWFGRASQKKWPEKLTREGLALEYGEWMRERWNHPSVVIWDASNETSSSETWPAVDQVRHLDLSNRPWDNSYEYPRQGGDVFESHPYHFNNPNFKLSQLEKVERAPQGNVQRNDQKHAVIINEYGWLWLNRDGTPTTLTSNLYQNLLGPNSTVEQRRDVYARYMAAETEFWRFNRKAGGVLHFTTLGYSRPDGQTSDHWTDVKNLKWEPEFYRYVKDAFEPVGPMIDFWQEKVLRGSEKTVPIVVVNDFGVPWEGPVRLKLSADGAVRFIQERICRVEPYGVGRVEFAVKFPTNATSCRMEAELQGSRAERGGRVVRNGRVVRSTRVFKTVEAEDVNLASNRPVTASSTLNEQYAPSQAVDDDESSYWSSEFRDDAWLSVDLGRSQRVRQVQILWENAYAKAFFVEVSADGSDWREIYRTADGKGGVTEVNFEATQARWVRVTGTARGTKWGYGIRELSIR